MARARKKPAITITLSQELLDWIETKIKDKTFADRSHAIEQAVFKLKKEYEE